MNVRFRLNNNGENNGQTRLTRKDFTSSTFFAINASDPRYALFLGSDAQSTRFRDMLLPPRSHCKCLRYLSLVVSRVAEPSKLHRSVSQTPSAFNFPGCVERMNEKAIEVATIGRDEKVSRKQDELPLPLTSVAFEDKAKQPSLLQVATVINSVSVVGGKYNFYDKNCFWFAFTTFDTVRLAFSGTLKNLLWVNPGAREGSSIGDAWRLGFSTMLKDFFKACQTFSSEPHTQGDTS